MTTPSTWMVITAELTWAPGDSHLAALQNLLAQTGVIPESYVLFEVQGDHNPYFHPETKKILAKAEASIVEHGSYIKTEKGFQKS